MNNQKQIIFLEPWPTPMIAKIAKLFKKKGYRVVSIRILQSDDNLRAIFDEVISFNLAFFRINFKTVIPILFSLIKKSKDIFKAIRSILKLKPYIIFTRSQPSWPCALAKIIFKKYPMIYFPYDIRSQGYVSKETMKEIGTRDFEIKAEKYCFENADGILHKGADDELEKINTNILGTDLKMCPLQIHFPPYCSEEYIISINKNKLSAKDKEIHTITAESMSAVGPAIYLLDYIKELEKQKIHLHAYIRQNTTNNSKIVSDSFDKDIFKYKYFHLHPPLEPKELIKEISKYDYGLILINSHTKDLSEILAHKFSTGNKIASYFEAGLPFIYSKELEYIDKLMKGYKLDLRYTKDLKKLIKGQDYKQLERNVLKARKEFLMEKHFPELEKFVKKVVEARRIKNERNNLFEL